jgi:hypothetical protein
VPLQEVVQAAWGGGSFGSYASGPGVVRESMEGSSHLVDVAAGAPSNLTVKKVFILYSHGI